MSKRVYLLLALLLVMLPVVMGAAQENIVSIGKAANVDENSVVENVVIIGANAVIRGEVRENVVVIFGDIHLEPTAVVRGDTVAVGGAVIRQSGAQVHGENVSVNVRDLPRFSFGSGFFRPFWWGRGADSIWKVLSVVFLGWVAFWLFPKPVQNVAVAAEAEPLKAVLYGLLGYLAVLPLTIMLVITILGILLVPVLWVGVVLARFLGQVALGLMAGKYIFTYLKREESPVISVVVGLLVLGSITLIPVVGSLASLFYSLLGFGAVLWTRFGKDNSLTNER
jgi:hypothetical protein